MSDPQPPSLKPVPKRGGIWLNVFVQLVALLFIVVVVNILSNRRFQRWDWSSSGSFTLSGSSLNYLRKLGREVQLVVLVPRSSKLYSELLALTEEYRRNGKERVKVEFVDPLLDLDRTEQLKHEYALRLDQSGVLVRTNKRQRFIPESELVVLGPGFDKDHPTMDFRGEDAITTAMAALTDAAPRKIYALLGKGGDAGKALEQHTAVLNELGKQLAFETGTLDLATATEVPKDATGLVIVAPRYDLTERELGTLTSYWNEKRASLLVMLDPSAQTPRLDRFLDSVGIKPRGDRVIYAESRSTGPHVEFTVTGGFSVDSNITRHLAAALATFAGQTQSLDVRDRDETLKSAGNQVTKLMVATDRYWGETGYVATSAEQPPSLPIAGPEDTKSPVCIAASVERGAVQDERLRVESARMVVIGNASLMDKETRLAVNQDFLGACLAWMTGRERLLGILPKRKELYRIQLSDAERQSVFLVTAIIGPALVLVIGLLIWAHRRAS